jgi:hypothetical protein
MLMISTIGLYARPILPEKALTETKKQVVVYEKVIKI